MYLELRKENTLTFPLSFMPSKLNMRLHYLIRIFFVKQYDMLVLKLDTVHDNTCTI